MALRILGLHFSPTEHGYESMANFTQDTSVQLPVDEVSTYVKEYRIEAYSQIVLATVVTYDASEFPTMTNFWVGSDDFQVCTFDKEVSAHFSKVYR